MSAATVEDLHEALFGYRPDKAGTAYERLSALVFASLEWADVKHDVREAGQGRRTKHQIDVTATDPSGQVRRLLVECKDWDKKVGKGTLDALVGVRNPLGADAAAVVTTKGYTKGAVDVAVDEDIALILLSPYDPDGDLHFVMKIVVDYVFYYPSIEDYDFEVWPDHELPAGRPVRVGFTIEDHLSHLDGTKAEQIIDVMKNHSTAPLKEGRYPQRADFPDGRLMPTVDGAGLPIAAMTWTENNIPTKHQQVIESDGEPMLVLQQLDEKGEPQEARLFVDTALNAWDIDEAGSVVQRGPLLPKVG